MGKQMYLKYQFNKSGCNNIQAMREYLQDSEENSDELIEMLKSKPNLNVDTFTLILNEALKRVTETKVEEKLLQVKQRLVAF